MKRSKPFLLLTALVVPLLIAGACLLIASADPPDYTLTYGFTSADDAPAITDNRSNGVRYITAGDKTYATANKNGKNSTGGVTFTVTPQDAGLEDSMGNIFTVEFLTHAAPLFRYNAEEAELEGKIPAAYYYNSKNGYSENYVTGDTMAALNTGTAFFVNDSAQTFTFYNYDGSVSQAFPLSGAEYVAATGNLWMDVAVSFDFTDDTMVYLDAYIDGTPVLIDFPYAEKTQLTSCTSVNLTMGLNGPSGKNADTAGVLDELVISSTETPARYPSDSYSTVYLYVPDNTPVGDGIYSVLNQRNYSAFLLAKDQAFTLPRTFTKGLTVFRGWYLAPDCSGEPVTELYAPASGTVLYADLLPLWYQCDFDTSLTGNAADPDRPLISTRAFIDGGSDKTIDNYLSISCTEDGAVLFNSPSSTSKATYVRTLRTATAYSEDACVTADGVLVGFSLSTLALPHSNLKVEFSYRDDAGTDHTVTVISTYGGELYVGDRGIRIGALRADAYTDLSYTITRASGGLECSVYRSGQEAGTFFVTQSGTCSIWDPFALSVTAYNSGGTSTLLDNLYICSATEADVVAMNPSLLSDLMLMPQTQSTAGGLAMQATVLTGELDYLSHLLGADAHLETGFVISTDASVIPAADSEGCAILYAQPDAAGILSAVWETDSDNPQLRVQKVRTFLKITYPSGAVRWQYGLVRDVTQIGEALLCAAKGGADGIVPLVHDDGTLDTMQYVKGLLDLYNTEEDPLLKMDIAMLVSRLWDPDTQTVLSDDTVAKWQTLLDTGYFEMSNHSMTHSHYGVDEDDLAKLTLEIITSGEVLRQLFPEEEVLTFVYPGFEANEEGIRFSQYSKDLIMQYYLSARGLSASAANPIAGADYSYLASISCSQTNLDQIKTRLEKAADAGLWEIVFFHTVTANGQASGVAVDRAYMEELIAYTAGLVSENRLWCATLEEATRYTHSYENAVLTHTVAEDRITLVLSDQTEDDRYRTALTVRVTVDPTWESVTLTQNGTTATLTPICDTQNGCMYVYADIVPDGTEAVLTAG